MKKYVVFCDDKSSGKNNPTACFCSIENAKKYTKKGVCTLPLAFIQIAPYVKFIELIYIGIQICSLHNNNQICSLHEIVTCAQKLVGLKGRKKVLTAAKYIKEKSRSPAEAIMYLYLGLPNNLGGFGIKGIRFNEKLTVDCGAKCYYADLYVPEGRFDLEFDSFQFHNNNRSFSQDAIRAAKLEAEGYTVIPVKYEQLKNPKEMEVLAKIILRKQRKTLRVRAQNFLKEQKNIQSLLWNH